VRERNKVNTTDKGDSPWVVEICIHPRGGQRMTATIPGSYQRDAIKEALLYLKKLGLSSTRETAPSKGTK
jgi:hypothetical protein